jgi:DNA-3-methyladenine glycosylase II
VRSGASTWLIAVNDLLPGVQMTVVDGPCDAPAPDVTRVDAPILVGSELGSALAPLVPLSRVRNPSLWDAIATATVAKIVTAGQARSMYRRFCAAYGDPVDTPYGPDSLFPDSERVLWLPAEAFSALKMSFIRMPLQAAARAYREHGAMWSRLDPGALVTALRSVAGVGPWTAGTAVADFSGDFAFYPYPDRVILACVRRAAPATDWPCSEAPFRKLWRAMAGDNVSGLTQLVLAWGENHRPPARHEHTDQPLTGELPEPADLLEVLQI